MKKNIIIAVLAVVAIVSFISTYQMSSRASYWMQRCDAAEKVIQQVDEDRPDYVMDGLMGCQAWEDWTNLGGDQ